MGYPARLRDEMCHSFPQKRVNGDLFYGIPSARDSYFFQCTPTVANYQIQILIKATAGASIVFDWGDGSTSIPNIPTSTGIVTIQKVYSQVSVYNINLYGEVSAITFINASNQKLTGELPPNIAELLPNLEYLNIVSNLITGMMPSFAKCPNLEYFYAQETRFSSLASFNENVKLKIISVYACPLIKGDIPSFSNCINLEICNIGYNAFSGEIPSFNDCVKLKEFSVRGNSRLTGLIPSFANCLLLERFNCSGCYGLSGQLPSFNTNVALIFFDVSTNVLTGQLPPVDQLVNMTTFNCQGNQFSGSIPSFVNCVKLQSFFGGGALNAWTGTVPYFPSSLKTFSLSGSYSSNLVFPIDLFSSLVDIEVIDVARVAPGSPKTIFNVSNNTKLKSLNISDNATASFNNGTINYNCTELLYHRLFNNSGVALNFDNLLTANNSGSFYLALSSSLNIYFPLGSKIRTQSIYVDNNGMSQENVDASINDLFANRNQFLNSISHVMTCAGSNATPSGTYQQPSGFTHDLTEAEITTLSASWSVKEKIWILVNCQESSINTTKRYKWTITTS